MGDMITVSDNVAATGLFYFGGGCHALTLFDTLIPTRHTSVGCETPTYYGWGNTTTHARRHGGHRYPAASAAPAQPGVRPSLRNYPGGGQRLASGGTAERHGRRD